MGVVGSVALFTLDAKVAKLEEENRELKQKIETLQQKNDTLNIMSLDLKYVVLSEISFNSTFYDCKLSNNDKYQF